MIIALIKRIKNSILHRLYRLMSEKTFLKYHISHCLGYEINIDNPKTFNEKLNWMKLYDRNPKYTIMADKYRAKQYVANIIGGDYIVPCYGVWDNFENINFNDLPPQFVLKATHQSGVVICRDKELLDYSYINEKFKIDLKKNYYEIHKEWVYKDIPPRIIADKFLDDKTGAELRDYKFWCFNGIPKVVYLTNKGKDVYENFYDMNFSPLNINHGFPRKFPEFEEPKEFEKMKELAKILSAEIPFVRVDFFVVDGNIYFGEFTFYDWGGAHPFESYEQDYMIGQWLKLPIE